MSHRCTIRRQFPQPVYLPRNTGSAFGLQYAALAGMSAVVIMPMFLSIATGLTHIFDKIGASL
jgi:Flp pilus assembly pilin Flp